MIKKIIIILILLGIAVPGFAYDITWSQTNGPYGGSFWTMTMPTQESSKIYAAAYYILKTDDKSENWFNPDDTYWSGLSVAVDPSDPTRLYSGRNDGRVKFSSNEGQTWDKIHPNVVDEQAYGSANLYNLAVHPNTSEVFTSSYNRLFRIKLYDSSPSWEEITSLNSILPVASDMVFNININPNTSDIILGTHQGILISSDEGVSWTNVLDTDTRIIEITPTKIWAKAYIYLYSSTDEGYTWERTYLTPFNALRNFGVHYNDPNVLYADVDDQMKFSSDAGNTWRPAYVGLPESTMHPLGKIIVSPDNSSEAYVSAWGDGVYKTTNAGMSWQRKSEGFSSMRIYDLDVITHSGTQYLFAGTSITFGNQQARGSGIWRSINQGQTWTRLLNGLLSVHDLRCVEIDKRHSGHVYVGGGGTGITDYSGMFMSKNFGDSFQGLNSGLSSSRFITDIKIDYSEDQTDISNVFIATNGSGVYKGVSGPGSGGVQNWIPLSTEGLQSFNVLSIAVDTSEEGQSLYAGTENGGLFKINLDEASPTWEQIVPVETGDFASENVNCIVVDTDDPNLIFVGTNGSLFVSEDGGSTWDEKSVAASTSRTYNNLLLDDWTTPHDIYALSSGYVFKSSEDSNWGAWTFDSFNRNVFSIARDEQDFTYFVGTEYNMVWKGEALVALPTAPSSFMGSATSYDSIDWTWTDNSTTEFGYKFIKLAPTTGEVYLPESSEDYSEVNLYPNTIYTREVIAYNSVESTASNSSAECTWAIAPTNLRATSWEGDRIRLNWDIDQSGLTNPAYTKYVIEMSNVSTGAFSPDSTQEVSLPPPYYFNFLVPRNYYRFRVRAENLLGIQTGFSNLITEETIHETLGPEISDIRFDGRYLIEGDIVMPDPVITARIRDLATTPESPTSITKETITLVFADYYQVDGPQIDSLVSAGSYYDMTHEIKVPLGAGEHMFYIEAYDELGNRGTSVPTTINVMAGGVNMIGETIAYPAPYSPKLGGDAIFTYNLSIDAPITIYLFDISGQIMWTKKYSTGINGGRAGYNEVRWDGKTDFGGTIGNGIFIYQILSKGKKIGSGKLIVYD